MKEEEIVLLCLTWYSGKLQLWLDLTMRNLFFLSLNPALAIKAYLLTINIQNREQFPDYAFLEDSVVDFRLLD